MAQQNNSQAHLYVLLEKPFVEISFDAQQGILIAIWKGSLSLEEVKLGCALMAEFIRENKVLLHLSNHTQLKALSPEVQQYLSGTWFLEVERAGLRKIGVKQAKDIFTQATVRKVNQQNTYGLLEIKSFGSNEEAIQWLFA